MSLARQVKYLNDIVEQDHGSIKRITRLMLGSKSLWSARSIISGMEIMRMIGKGQLGCPEFQTMSAVQQFYSVRSPTQQHNFLRPDSTIA